MRKIYTIAAAFDERTVATKLGRLYWWLDLGRGRTEAILRNQAKLLGD